MRKLFVWIFSATYVLINGGCKKLVAIPPPVNSVTTSQVFSNDLEANQAMTGVYSGMVDGGSLTAFRGGITAYAGASADELNFFSNYNVSNTQFQDNNLLPNNIIVLAFFWNSMYSTIYGCNAVIEGVQSAPAVHDSVRSELIGEAEFTRAFCYFYLVNIFGEVPLVTTTNYNKTSLLARSSTIEIDSDMVEDLKDAQRRLRPDYLAGHNERIVPNQWAATAMLARVFLYSNDWPDAAIQSTNILGNASMYQLTASPGDVFNKNSTESIWQLQITPQQYPFNAVPEGNFFIPGSQTAQPIMYLAPSLLGAFEDSDQRRVFWIDSTLYFGNIYYFPFKYTIGPGQEVPNAPPSQYYTVLRLGEQYLIRAEAEANGAGGGLSAAIQDLNTIRFRAGLPNYMGPATQDSVLAAIYHEDQVEFCFEWGHRWLDLKRWGTAASVLSGNKGIVVSGDALLYPIPLSDLQTDPNLSQNEGYSY